MKNRFSCSEPQNNMYISRDGLVKVCCHNHYFEIGDLKKNSLFEIWNSEKRKEFAKLLFKSCDEASCGDCTLKQPEKKNVLFFTKEFKVSKYPKSIEFELSNKCNLECIMCSPLYSNQIAKRYSELTDDSFNFSNIIEQLEPFMPHLKEAKFYGGEPFIIEQYLNIWEYIISKNSNVNFYIQTNGTILNEKIKSILNKGIFNIGVSLESINEETYKNIRVNAELQKVLLNIDYFNQYSKQKNTFFGIAICPIRSNWNELTVMVEYFNKKDIPINFHQVVRPFNVSLWNLPKDELNNVYSTLSKYSFTETKNQVSVSNLKQFNNLLKQILDWYNLSIENENILNSLSDKTEQQLLAELEVKATNFLNSILWMDQKLKDDKTRLFINKLNKVCEKISDKNILQKQLAKLQLSPIYIVLGEIERISIQELKENILSI